MIAKNLRCSRATPTESTYCSFAGDFSAHRAVKTVGAPILLRDAKRTWRRRRFYCATRRELGEGADFTTRREENSAKAPISLSDAKRTRRRRRFYCATRRELDEGADFTARREEKSAEARSPLRDAKRNWRCLRFFPPLRPPLQKILHTVSILERFTHYGANQRAQTKGEPMMKTSPLPKDADRSEERRVGK